MIFILSLFLQVQCIAGENIILAGQKICAQMSWIKGPTSKVNQESAFQIQFTDCALKTPIDVKPSFNLDMIEMHMSMKAPGVKPLSQTGFYEVSDMYLGMSGKWFIEIKVNGQTTRVPFSI